MRYVLIWESKGLLVKVGEQVTSSEVSEVVRNFQSDERYDNLRYVIYDTLGCTGAAYNENELLELAATDGVAGVTNPHQRVAVVADHPAIFAFIQKYLSSGFNLHEIRIFSSMPEARAWSSRQGMR